MSVAAIARTALLALLAAFIFAYWQSGRSCCVHDRDTPLEFAAHLLGL